MSPTRSARSSSPSRSPRRPTARRPCSPSAPSDAVEQMRDALAVGCTAAVLIEADADCLRSCRRGARDRRGGAAHEAAGTSYDLVLLGNDAADTGDFQVGVRLAYALDRPVLTGISTIEVHATVVVARWRKDRRAPRCSRSPLPAVIARDGGRRRAALPVDPRPDEGQAGARSTRSSPSREPVGSGRVRLEAAADTAERGGGPRHGPDAAPAVVDLLVPAGSGAEMSAAGRWSRPTRRRRPRRRSRR